MKPSRTVAEVITALDGAGVLPLARRVAGSLPLERALHGGDLAERSTRAAILAALNLTDPVRWTGRELADLVGRDYSRTMRALRRGRALLKVHLARSDELTACGRAVGSLEGRAVAVDRLVLVSEYLNCSSCSAAWRER